MKKSPDRERLKAGQRIRSTDRADWCGRGNKTEKCWTEICFRPSWSSYLIDTLTFRGNGVCFFYKSVKLVSLWSSRGNPAVTWCLWKHPSTSQNLRGQKKKKRLGYFCSCMMITFLIHIRILKTARKEVSPYEMIFYMETNVYSHT